MSRETVGDRLDSMESRRSQMQIDGKPSEWIDRLDEAIARLRIHDRDMVLLTAPEAVYGDLPWLGEVERWAIRWQRNRDLALDPFETKLIALATECDDSNLDLLALGFPDVVAMIRQWRGGDLAERLRGMPFEFSL